ncbi:MAG: membrane protein insertase YidC [Coprococcus sp.]
MFLTVEDGLILGPVCWLFGHIFELIYKFVEFLTPGGVVNLSICVVLFTFFIRACLFPVNFKQQKSNKIMNFIQPEINKATKKYNGKTDQDSMMKKNEITMKIQKKYGVSMTAGCLPAILQLPVFYGLYRVIQNIPAYVSDMKDKYQVILDTLKTAEFNKAGIGLENTATYIDVINAVATDADGSVNTAVAAARVMMNNVADGKVADNLVIDVLDKMSSTDWNQLTDLITSNIPSTVTTYINNFHEMNSFLFGLNISEAPGWKLSIALIIPIVSAVSQFLTSKISQLSSNNSSNDAVQNQMNGTMKFMNIFFPIMSFFICISCPIAIGLYWIIGAVISIITQLIINAYYNKCDMEKVLEKCKEKAAKKQEKKDAKHPNKKSFYERMMDAQNGNVSTDERQSENINKMASSRLKSYNNPATDDGRNSNTGTTHYKAGSIASKANIMLQYQNNSNDKGGRK